MFYKLNMFLREWEGYNKLYNFILSNLFIFHLIRVFLYASALVLCFFENTTLTLSLQIIVYLFATILEYFYSSISWEASDKVISIIVTVLFFLDLLVVVSSLSLLIFGIN